MRTYISLLRGINVSGKNMIKMAELEKALTATGFLNLRTYIQSGNVAFEYEENEPGKVSEMVSDTIKERFNLVVPSLTIFKEELIRIHTNNPFLPERNPDRKSLYITFLDKNPENQQIGSLPKEAYLPDEFIYGDRAIYLFCPDGYGSTKLNNSFIERKLGVMATTRNFNTVEKLCAL